MAGPSNTLRSPNGYPLKYALASSRSLSETLDLWFGVIMSQLDLSSRTPVLPRDVPDPLWHGPLTSLAPRGMAPIAPPPMASPPVAPNGPPPKAERIKTNRSRAIGLRNQDFGKCLNAYGTGCPKG
jgi:hypothetical protein